MEDGERPWIKPHVHTPAAHDPQPGDTRKRPLIFVYELPPMFNSLLLQVCLLRSCVVKCRPLQSEFSAPSAGCMCQTVVIQNKNTRS